MNWFRSNTPEAVDMVDLSGDLDAEISAFAEEVTRPITDHAADAATAMLRYADEELTDCDRILAEAGERRRRAIIVRDAYAPVLQKLIEHGGRSDEDRLASDLAEIEAEFSISEKRKRSKPALVQAGE